jgi:putative nucleotidyltransferase with HDIG domain
VWCGLAAKAIATQANCLNTERLFVAGLMHDIGTLTINARFPEIAEEGIFKAHGDEGKLVVHEHESLGFDHAYLGAMMLENWHMPHATVDAIRYHHNPQAAKVTTLEASILNAADALANYSGTGSFAETIVEENDMPINDTVMQALPSTFDRGELMEEVDQQFVETIYLLLE